MDRQLDAVVNDVIALDPELASREAEIRNILAVFFAVKPSVEIDGAFTNRVRAALVKPTVAPPAQSPWFGVWALRLAPVAATLLLVLMLVPSFMRSPSMVPGEFAPQNYSESTMRDTGADTVSTKRTAGAPATDTFSLSSVAEDGAEYPSVSISSQAPDNSVRADFANFMKPGFVVIHENISGDIGAAIGTSTLLAAGMTTDVVVSLARPTALGETYFGVLYTDDGDEVFDARSDTPVYDASGVTPLTVLFSIESVTPEIFPRY